MPPSHYVCGPSVEISVEISVDPLELELLVLHSAPEAVDTTTW